VALFPKVPPVTTEEAVLAVPRIAIWTGAISFPAGGLEKWKKSRLERGETVGDLLARWDAGVAGGTRFLSFAPERIELFDAIDWLRLESVVHELLGLAAKAGATGEVTVVGDDERAVRTIWTLARKKLGQDGGTVDRKRIPAALKKIWPRFGPWLAKHRTLDGAGLRGYIGTDGKFAIPPAYERAYDFAEGFGIVWRERDRGYFFVDPAGKKIAGPFSYADSFREGLAPASAWVNDRQKIGYIDPKGRWVIEPRFEEARAFTNGLAQIYDGRESRTIDKRGRFVDAVAAPTVVGPRNAKFPSAGPFSEGRAAAGRGKFFGHIDEQGEWITPPIFDDAQTFSGGFARIKLDGAYGFVDRGGRLHSVRWTDAQTGFTDGRAWVQVSDRHVS
jgi:hypothetical protein